MTCTHGAHLKVVTPSADGCEECLKIGARWVHLRLCGECGHVGCCDDSPNTHATKHFHATGHPIMETYDPPDGWGWCYVDAVMLDLEGMTTPHPEGWRYKGASHWGLTAKRCFLFVPIVR